MTRERAILISKCLDRLEKLVDGQMIRLQMFMDLEYSRVDPEALLSARDADFLHDMFGIAQHMDRENKRLAYGFVPRAGLVED